MDIVIRASVMFAIMYLLLRLLGKRELGQMSPIEVVTLVVMGDLIQQGITHNDYSLTGATLAISTFAFWSLVLAWLAYSFPRLRKTLEGEPRVLVQGGTLIERNLKRDRISLSEVEAEMRLAGIAHLKDVAWAILETNGKISFIEASGRRSEQQDDDATL